MGDVLTLDETQFGNGKLIFEYEDQASFRDYMPENVLRVRYSGNLGPADFVTATLEDLGEQIFPASDFPAALAIYRKRKASKFPQRRIGGYYHVSTWLTPRAPEPLDTPTYKQAFDKHHRKIAYAIFEGDYVKDIPVGS